MSETPRPDFEKCRRRGMTVKETAKLCKAHAQTVYAWAERNGVAFRNKRSEEPSDRLRGSIDNALTAGFRAVLGWCPHRDGVPPGTRIIDGKSPKKPRDATRPKKPLDKTIVSCNDWDLI